MTPVACFLVLMLLTDGATSGKVCSYQDVLNHLNLTSENSVFKVTRPVLDYRHPTTVELDIILYAILAVIEKTQTFIPFIWATMMWNNELISWDPAQFCGITQVSVPREMLWRPDLFVYEMIQKDESPQNPYMYVSYDGTVTSEEDVKVVSTCKMDVHKFPFDTQMCNISIGSAIHSADEIRLLPFSNSTRATQFSREVMKTQGEWEFLHLLDLASFFISDHRGEKLGFKVTVLLAISVLLLILNDILPSMSNKTPLIATYCIVIFALMLLSLLETILVTYMMEIDSASQEKLRLKEDKEAKEEKVEADTCNTGEKRQTCCSCISQVSHGEKQHELLPLAEEVNRGVQSGESRLLVLILEELKQLKQTLNLHLSCSDNGRRSTPWASRVNRGFMIFYVTTVSLFLSLMFNEWNS
ncbi:hypothetical protein INR49_027253 [Caranx melampygus]|nr:hypothetical protein INR49_027253 [Caranx melampygus]